MTNITSIFDLFQKLKRDKRYERALIMAFRESSNYGDSFRGTSYFEQSMAWLDSWIKQNKNDTCQRMVEYLNKYITKIGISYPYPEPVLPTPTVGTTPSAPTPATPPSA
jgi:hypothetical protein